MPEAWEDSVALRVFDQARVHDGTALELDLHSSAVEPMRVADFFDVGHMDQLQRFDNAAWHSCVLRFKSLDG